MSKSTSATSKKKKEDSKSTLKTNIEPVLTYSTPYTDSVTVHNAHIEYHKLLISEIYLKERDPQKHKLIQSLDRKRTRQINQNVPQKALYQVIEKGKEMQKRQSSAALEDYFVLLDMDREIQQQEQRRPMNKPIDKCITPVLEELSKTRNDITENASRELDGLLQAKENLKQRFLIEYQMYKQSSTEMKGTHTMRTEPNSLLQQALFAANEKNIQGADKAMDRFLYLKKLEGNWRILLKDSETTQQNRTPNQDSVNTLTGKIPDENYKNGSIPKETSAKPNHPFKQQELPGNPENNPSKSSVVKMQGHPEKNPSKSSTVVTMQGHPEKNPSKSPVVTGQIAKKNEIRISKLEYERLMQDLQVKDEKIEELTRRLSRLAGDKLVGGNPNIADLSDKNRPTKLGEMFGSLYDDEWSDAFEAMKEMKKCHEDQILMELQNVVLQAYEFSKSAAEKQMQQLQAVMVNPFHGSTEQPLAISEDFDFCVRQARDFRKTTATTAILTLCQYFRSNVIPEKFKWQVDRIPQKILSYIDKSIRLTWLMRVQDPPMYLQWAQEKQNVNNDFFKCYGKTGQNVKFTVWPAVILCDGGPVVSKGYVKTE